MNRYALRPFWLDFVDPAVEAAWQADFAQDLRAWLPRALGLLALVFGAFAVHDVLLYPTLLVPLWSIRAAVVTGLLGARAFLATPRGDALLRVRPQRVLLTLGVGMCVAMVGLGVVLLPHPSRTGLWFATLGFQLALVGVYAVSRLRFRHAVVLGVGVTLSGITLLHLDEEGLPLGLVGPFGLAMNLTGAWITRSLELLGRRAFVGRARLAEAQARSEALLRNVLPDAIAARLRDDGVPSEPIAARHDDVTVIVADLVGFTPLCERLPPSEIATLLDRLFRDFDDRCARHGVEKIKTLGDAWLAAAGVPEPRADHAEAAARLALDLVASADPALPLRVGLAAGPAVTGVIGRTRFAYDLWGAALEEATAMERGGAPGRIRVSEALALRLSPGFEVRRDDEGWWLVGPRP